MTDYKPFDSSCQVSPSPFCRVREFPRQAVVSRRGNLFKVHEVCPGGGPGTLSGPASFGEIVGAALGARGGRRGEIRGFSAASRKRLCERVAGLDHMAVERFWHITLTFGQRWPETKEEIKVVLARFRRRFERRWGRLACLWRVEVQWERYLQYGDLVPHFHLVVFDAGWIKREGNGPGIWSVLRAMWTGCIQEYMGPRDVELARRDTGLSHGEGVSPEDGKHLIFYVAKYCGKTETAAMEKARKALEKRGFSVSPTVFSNAAYLAAGLRWGRVWGWWNPELLPEAELESFAIEWGCWVERVRMLSGAIYSPCRLGNTGWTIMDDAAGMLFERCCEYVLEEFSWAM